MFDVVALGELLIETAVQAIHGPVIHGPAAHGPAGDAPEEKGPADAVEFSGDVAARRGIPPRVQMIQPELVIRDSSGKNCSD